MPTLILAPRHSPDSQRVWRAGIGAGWRVERPSGWTVSDSVMDPPIAYYGEPLFGAAVAQQLQLGLMVPTNGWLPGLPHDYLHRRVSLCHMADARRITQPTFVKPVRDKTFPAAVYPSGDDLPDGNRIDDDEPVLTSEPVRWLIEFRFFVLEGQAVASSPYLRDGELVNQGDGTWEADKSQSREASDFLHTLLADSRVDLPPAIVIDVGLIDGKAWAVIEANAAWASGIYGCPASDVLPVIARACRPLNHDDANDSRWFMVD